AASDDSDTGNGDESDASASCEPDDGFDGQCAAPSLTASAESTAECSRSASLRSSKHSGEASDGASSASTEPSLTWWRRRFLGARPKLPAKATPPSPSPPGAPSRRATVSARSVAVPDSPELPVPILARLRRSVPSKPAARRLLLLGTRAKACRADVPLPAASAATHGSTPQNDAAASTSFDVHWTMLKCKGASDFHVVSVAASASSLNHNDVFLFYPCLLHRPAPGTGADNQCKAAHEHSRRKSVCALASHTIYVWLGARASAAKRDAITHVALEVRDRELLGTAGIVIVDEASSTAAADAARRRFFAQLYAVEHGRGTSLPNEMSAVYCQLTPPDKAGSDADFERALQRRKVLYGFWEAVPPGSIVAAGSYVSAAALAKVPAGGAVILDTWSDVFIWWRDEPASPAVRRCAVSYADALVRDVCIPPRPGPGPAPVWHEIQGSEHVLFKTKFPDWPFVFGASTPTGHGVPQPALCRSMLLAARPVAVA
ncbi:hypothetical protein H4R19_002036, partial [Coemansia spiralis]